MNKKLLVGWMIFTLLVIGCTQPSVEATKPSETPTQEPTTTTKPEPTPIPEPTPSLTPIQIRAIFFGHPYGDPNDHETMGQVCKELGFSFETRDYRFLNNEVNWFDEKSQRKFHIIIFPGGHSSEWFEKARPGGINEKGCENIRRFIIKGGSCWAICYTGNAVFAETMEYRGFTKELTETGIELNSVIYKNPGWMVKYYGGKPVFKGIIRGPQETNWPYPRVRFLPISLNMEHQMVEEEKLPEKVYLSTVASPSLIPNPDQPMEVIGWFPNRDAAIGIMKYGDGHLYMVPPHASQTFESVLELYIKRWEANKYWEQNGTSEETYNEGKAILMKEGDPDGSEPDLSLAKALLRDAASRASPPI
ncbi:hypothetical protein ACFLVM_00990 [Chloroflexota bacterium]